MESRTLFKPIPRDKKEIFSKKQISSIIKRQAHDIAQDVPNDSAVILLNTERNNPAYADVLARKLHRINFDTVANYIAVGVIDGKTQIEIAPVIHDAQGRTVIIAMPFYDNTKKEELDVIITHLRDLKVSRVYLAVFLVGSNAYLSPRPNFVGYHINLDVEQLSGYGFGSNEERHLHSLRIPAFGCRFEEIVQKRSKEDSAPLLHQRMYQTEDSFFAKLIATDNLIARSKVQITREEIKKQITKGVQSVLDIIQGREFVLLIMQKGGSQFATSVRKEFGYHDTPAYTVDSYHPSSYEESMQSGALRVIDKGKTDLKGKIVFICEDIIDTGKTMEHVIKDCFLRGALEVHLFALGHKPGKLKVSYNTALHSSTILFEVKGYAGGRGLDFGIGKFRASDAVVVVPEPEEKKVLTSSDGSPRDEVPPTAVFRM